MDILDSISFHVTLCIGSAILRSEGKKEAKLGTKITLERIDMALQICQLVRKGGKANNN